MNSVLLFYKQEFLSAGFDDEESFRLAKICENRAISPRLLMITLNAFSGGVSEMLNDLKRIAEWKAGWSDGIE